MTGGLVCASLTLAPVVVWMWLPCSIGKTLQWPRHGLFCISTKHSPSERVCRAKQLSWGANTYTMHLDGSPVWQAILCSCGLSVHLQLEHIRCLPENAFCHLVSSERNPAPVLQAHSALLPKQCVVLGDALQKRQEVLSHRVVFLSFIDSCVCVCSSSQWCFSPM